MNATRDQIAALLHEGMSNLAISRQLRCDKGRVRRVRRELGIADVQLQPLSLEEKWLANTREVDGGHLEWTGERGRSNDTPVMRYREKTYTAARIAFRIRTGREPVGYAFAECDQKHCIAPDHVEDEPGRQAAREQLRYLLGGQQRAETCSAGHGQAEHGKYAPGGTAYCAKCSSDRKQAAA